MAIYDEVPFLAILEKRKDLLPDINKIDDSMLEDASKHLRSILFYGKSPELSTPARFFLEANLVSFSPSRHHLERFSLYYATLSVEAFKRGDPLLRKHYPPVSEIPLDQFLPVPRPFPELKLYHLIVGRGQVRLDGREHLFGASLLYRDILRWIEEKVQPLVSGGYLDSLRPWAEKALKPPGSKSSRTPAFIARLISATGLPDGRKRILYYWLIPYWAVVEGRGTEETLNLALDWVSRQGGGRIQPSWIRSEIENVKVKGIRPWSLGKVERIDPEIVKMLRGMGVL